MNRRRFLRNAAGLFVPMSFGIIAKAQEFRFGSQLKLKAGSAACATQQLQTTSGGSGITMNQGIYGIASPWTPGSSYTVCTLQFYIKQAGTATGNISASVWSNSAGSPGSNLGSSGSIAANTISTTSSWVSFTGLSVAVTSGTQYWYALIGTTSPGAGNGITAEYNNAAGTAKYYDGVSSWAALISNQFAVTIISQ